MKGRILAVLAVLVIGEAIAVGVFSTTTRAEQGDDAIAICRARGQTTPQAEAACVRGLVYPRPQAGSWFILLVPVLLGGAAIAGIVWYSRLRRDDDACPVCHEPVPDGDPARCGACGYPLRV